MAKLLNLSRLSPLVHKENNTYFSSSPDSRKKNRREKGGTKDKETKSWKKERKLLSVLATCHDGLIGTNSNERHPDVLCVSKCETKNNPRGVVLYILKISFFTFVGSREKE